MIFIPMPTDSAQWLSPFMEFTRRAIDGTIIPLFVDYVNLRVLIGATTVSSATAGVLEVAGDIKITSVSKGIILTDANGKEYRLFADTDGAIRMDAM